MALRMVEGSVFAVLMRSPWYYSAIIAFSLISLSLMIAGGKFFLFGIAAAFPFLVILGMVAYRNAQLPSRQRIIEVDQLARKTPYRKIAHRIAVNYENARFDVEPCKDAPVSMHSSHWLRPVKSTRRPAISMSHLARFQTPPANMPGRKTLKLSMRKNWLSTGMASTS